MTMRPDDPNREELRIALVMNGGVSLAVWIGGLTNEVNRVVRREGGYGELLDLLQVRVCVDVISGTSAGGINGALLALALVRGQSLEMLQDLWVEKAALGALLRDPLEPLPSSLLRGDAYFLRELRNAFAQLNAVGGVRAAAEVPIDLTLTTTLLKGENVLLADDFGRSISDVRHAARFRFRRGVDVEDDVFARGDIVDRLALASRSTASFPVAFEPSFVPVNAEKSTEGRPDLGSQADFRTSRFVMDGGILDNKPLRPAMDAITRQRIEGDVRRVLMYVVPDPGESGSNTPDEFDKPPSARDAAIASLLQIPRVEPVASEIREIRDRNRRVLEERESRVILTNTIGSDRADRRIRQLSRALFPMYQARRTDPAISYVVSQLADGLALLVARQREEARASGAKTAPNLWLERQGHRAWLAQAFRARALPWVPQEYPIVVGTSALSRELEAATWGWGIRAVEHASSTMLDVLRRAQRIVPLGHAARSADKLPAFWRSAYDIAARLQRVRRSDGGYWQGKAASLATVLEGLQGGGAPAAPGETAQAVMPQLDAWVKTQLDEWKTREYADRASAAKTTIPAAMGELADAIAKLLHSHAGTVRQVAQQAATSVIVADQRAAAELQRLIDYLVPAAATARDVVLNIIHLEVVQYALGTSTDSPDQYVELIQVSGNTPSPFGGADRAADKLCGVQLGHFGAFYKRAWRANDWMYGRLDGAANLVQVVLGPDRLRRVALQLTRDAGQSIAQRAALEIQRIAVDNEPDGESRELLRSRWSLEAIVRELAYLDDYELPAPDALPQCADAVARRLQLGVLRESLVTLANAAEADEGEAGYAPGAASSLRRAVQQARQVSAGPLLGAGSALHIFLTHNVGVEKMADQVGTDLFSMTTAKAMAVAASVAYREGRDLGAAKQFLRTVRLVALAFYMMVRNLTQRSRTGAALNAAAITAGVTIVGLALFGVEKMPALVSTAGWVLFGGGILFALFRWSAAVVLAVLAGVIVWLLRGRIISLLPWLASDRWGPPIAIGVAAVLLMVLGSVRRPRSLQERLDQRRSGRR